MSKFLQDNADADDDDRAMKIPRCSSSSKKAELKMTELLPLSVNETSSNRCNQVTCHNSEYCSVILTLGSFYR